MNEPAKAKDVYDAISIIQARLPVIEKSATNPHFGSTFTPLEDVVRKVYPMLREMRVACLQPILETDRADAVKVKTLLRHIDSGTEVESVCELSSEVSVGRSGKSSMNKQQGQGSAITYARRYSLTALLGIACGCEDDDGGAPPAGDHGASQPQDQVSPDAGELVKFREWLKTIAPTREDAEALCSWLSASEMPGLSLNEALTQVHVSRTMARAITKITKDQGIGLEVMMANARDWHQKQKGQADDAA